MNFIYFGSSNFATLALKGLLGSHTPILVVTPPDAPKGRGKKLAPPPLAQFAKAHKLPLLQTPNANQEYQHLKSLKPELGILCDFGQFIKEPLLSLPILNLHPSLLPRWRGAAPIERAILKVDRVSGISIIKLVKELDAGPVCCQLSASLPIQKSEAYQELASLGARALSLCLDRFPNLEFREQLGEPSYAEKITKEDFYLNFQCPAAQLERIVGALEKGYLELEDPKLERLIVRRAAAKLGSLPEGHLTENLELGCQSGILELQEIQLPGTKVMSAQEFVRGHGIPKLKV